MSGYFDEQASANAAGFSYGHIQGTQEGLREGRAEGFNAGRQKGYDEGWNACVAIANQEMHKQKVYTNQYLLENDSLAKQISEQNRTNEILNERIAAMDEEISILRKKDKGMREVVTALKAFGEKLNGEIIQLEDKLKVRTRDCVDQVKKYNRNMVFMNAARAVLEDLTAGEKVVAKLVRDRFILRYNEEVAEGMKAGAILQPLEKDELFARTLPRTNKLIQKLLNA